MLPSVPTQTRRPRQTKWFAITRGNLKASTAYDRRQLHCVPLLPLKLGPGLRTAFATPMPIVWTALLCWALTCISAVQVLQAKANWPLLCMPVLYGPPL